MKALRLFILLCPLMLAGCSEPAPSGDWYDQSREHTEDRDAYIRDQVNLGVDEREARQNADLNYYIENTVRPRDADAPPGDDPR